MKKKLILIAMIIFGVLIAVIFILRFVLNGGEDTWICVDGSWVKHGQPKNPAPITGCVKKH